MASTRPPRIRPHRSRSIRGLWLAATCLALLLGLIGIALPGLPTVPFMLLASFCAARGSRRLHVWMRRNRRIGPMLRDWENGGRIRRRSKWLATAMMLLASLIMWFSPTPQWVWALASGIMFVTAIWLWRRPEPAERR